MRILKSITIIPKESAFDEYFINNDLLNSNILDHNQGIKLSDQLMVIHERIINFKLIYRGSRDGYEPTNLINAAKDFDFTICVIKSNHNKIFGAYAPIKWQASTLATKMKDGHRSFAYFFDNKNLRVCHPRADQTTNDVMYFNV